jgi:hypothetical protein
MKNTLFRILFLFISEYSKGQDSDLVETFWYLTEINLAGTILAPPVNEELSPPSLSFQPLGNSYTLSSCGCFCWGGNLNFGTDFFVLPEGLFLLLIGGCTIPENNNFDTVYFDEFFQHEIPAVSDNIHFNIAMDSEGNKQLTLTNSNGDTAIYGDQLLSIQATNTSSFSLISNPVENTLALQFATSTHNRTIVIYDIMGKLHSATKHYEGTTFLQDVSALNSELYVVVVTEGDKKSVKKFIKE